MCHPGTNKIQEKGDIHRKNLKSRRKKEGQTVHTIMSLKVVKETHDGTTALKKKGGGTTHAQKPPSTNNINDIPRQL